MSNFSLKFGFVLVCLLLSCCNCQLNFSTGWGKRGLAPPPGSSSGSSGSSPGQSAPATPCKASVESLMVIYKLIQNEAQKLIDCDKFSY